MSAVYSLRSTLLCVQNDVKKKEKRFLELIMRAFYSPTSNMIDKIKYSHILGYVDDIDVIAKMKLDVESNFLEIENFSSFGQMVNGDKTKVNKEKSKPTRS